MFNIPVQSGDYSCFSHRVLKGEFVPAILKLRGVELRLCLISATFQRSILSWLPSASEPCGSFQKCNLIISDCLLESAINLGARELTVFARCFITYWELPVPHIC